VAARSGLVGIVEESHAPEQTAGLGVGEWVVGVHLGAAALQAFDDAHGQRVAHIAGTRLERQAQHGHRARIQIGTQQVEAAADRLANLVLVLLQDRKQKRRLVAGALRDANQRTQVLLQARPAESNARQQVCLADPAVIAHPV